MGCLGIIFILLGCLSFFYAIWSIFTPYPTIAVPMILSVIFFIIGGIFDSISNSNQKKEDDEIKKKFNDDFMKNMNVNSIKFQIENNMICIIYTDDKRLFFGNIKNNEINEIPLDKILKIDIQVIVKEKTKQEILTLTPTFHTNKTILSYHFNIITETETINLIVDPTYQNKELLERFKLVLERDIKEIINQNNKE